MPILVSNYFKVLSRKLRFATYKNKKKIESFITILKKRSTIKKVVVFQKLYKGLALNIFEKISRLFKNSPAVSTPAVDESTEKEEEVTLQDMLGEIFSLKFWHPVRIFFVLVFFLMGLDLRKLPEIMEDREWGRLPSPLLSIHEYVFPPKPSLQEEIIDWAAGQRFDPTHYCDYNWSLFLLPSDGNDECFPIYAYMFRLNSITPEVAFGCFFSIHIILSIWVCGHAIFYEERHPDYKDAELVGGVFVVINIVIFIFSLFYIVILKDLPPFFK